MGWIVCIILLIPLVYLYIKYKEKNDLDVSQRNQLNTEIQVLNAQRQTLNTAINDLYAQAEVAVERYNNSQRDKTEELETYFEGQKRRRQEIMDMDMAQREEELNQSFETEKNNIALGLTAYVHGLEDQATEAQTATNETIKECLRQIQEFQAKAQEEQQKYEGLIEPIKRYEMEKQERLFYTIQLPEEYQGDIEYLLVNVAAKIQHPDIISKLVWSEYVKPYLDDTCKRVTIKDEPGIYKLTNIENNKAYIGKSTNVKKRIQDHFKSSIGIKSIADQAVHHEILKTGFWNWTIEIITYCDKDKLSELEKYYIEFFDTQNYGYNRNAGGGG